MLKHCVSSPHSKNRTLSKLDKDGLTSYRLYQQVDGFTKNLPQSEVLSIVIQQQLRSLIRRLLVFESNLRDEQKKIIIAIEEKDKVLDVQRKEIEELKERNKELTELLEQKSPRDVKRKRTQSVPNLLCVAESSHVQKLIMKYESCEMKPACAATMEIPEVPPVHDFEIPEVVPVPVVDKEASVGRKLLRDITNLHLSDKENIPASKMLKSINSPNVLTMGSLNCETPEKMKKKPNSNYDKFLEVTGLVQKSILTPSRIQKRKIKRNHVILRCNVNPALSRLVKEKLTRSSPNTEL